MRLWLSRNSDVPLKEQLSVQILLGIVSGDLAVGDRLPTTAQLARRWGIHPNTARAAYRGLAEHGWIEWRRGSGFYVVERDSNPTPEPAVELDHLIGSFLETARRRGHAMDDVRNRMLRWFSAQPPERVFVIEPEAELREILMAEIRPAVTLRVTGGGIEDCARANVRTGSYCVALYDHAAEVRRALPPSVPCLLLRSSSVPGILAGETRPSPDTLISVVSRWPGLLRWGRAVLSAVGIDEEAIELRDARQKGWDRGLDRSGLIVTDSLMATRLPASCRPRVFPVIAQPSLDELRRSLPSS